MHRFVNLKTNEDEVDVSFAEFMEKFTGVDEEGEPMINRLMQKVGCSFGVSLHIPGGLGKYHILISRPPRANIS